MFPQLTHEGADDPRSKLVDSIVVVAKLWELAFGVIVGYEPSLLTDHSNSRITNCGQAVGNHGQTSHAKGHGPQGSVVVQCHLEALIRILVVHVVNDVHGIDVNASKPLHQLFEPADNIVEIKVLALDGADCWTHLLACDFVAATVDCIEKAFGKIGAGAEELHLFAHEHG